MGYRNLEVLSRVLIMKSGKRLIEIEEDIKELNVLNPLIFKANNTKNNQTEGMYNIYSTYMRAFDVTRPSHGFTHCIKDALSFEESLVTCKALFFQDRTNLYMIARVIQSISWH